MMAVQSSAAMRANAAKLPQPAQRDERKALIEAKRAVKAKEKAEAAIWRQRDKDEREREKLQLEQNYDRRRNAADEAMTVNAISLLQ
jgi:hypothetical protein